MFKVSRKSGDAGLHMMRTGNRAKGCIIGSSQMVLNIVNYRVLKGAASHFIAKTCITDM